jgi:hypothetical protein
VPGVCLPSLLLRWKKILLIRSFGNKIHAAIWKPST